MKKLAAALVALIVIASPVPSYAAPGEPQHAPISPNTAFVGTPAFLGLTPCFVSETTAQSISCAVGSGVLYAIWTSGGVVGSYAVAIDTLSSGLVDINTRSGSAPRITPAIFTHVQQAAGGGGTFATVSSTDPSACGAGGFCPPYPVRFTNGLSVAPSATNVNEVLLYRLDATNATNPVLQ